LEHLSKENAFWAPNTHKTVAKRKNLHSHLMCIGKLPIGTKKSLPLLRRFTSNVQTRVAKKMDGQSFYRRFNVYVQKNKWRNGFHASQPNFLCMN
jgi:hypothetical protein